MHNLPGSLHVPSKSDKKNYNEIEARVKSSYHHKKVIITGVRGFIGSHLCTRLQQLKAEVHGVSRSVPAKTSEEISFWNGHLEDYSFVKKMIMDVKPDYIFHLSGFVSGLRDVNYVPVAFNSLLASTVNLLTVATQEGCKRIVLTGSQEEPDKEHSFPGSPYAAAKWACRSYASMFDKLYGTSILNPRIFMVYGPEQKDYRKLIPYVILALLKNETPRLTSGSRPVDWIYVDDVIDALVYGAVSDLTLDKPFDIGSGARITVKEIVDKIVGIMGSDIQPLFGHHAPRPFERIVSADINNLILKPTIGIDEGLTRTITWFKENYEKIIKSPDFLERESG